MTLEHCTDLLHRHGHHHGYVQRPSQSLPAHLPTLSGHTALFQPLGFASANAGFCLGSQGRKTCVQLRRKVHHYGQWNKLCISAHPVFAAFGSLCSSLPEAAPSWTPQQDTRLRLFHRQVLEICEHHHRRLQRQGHFFSSPSTPVQVPTYSLSLLPDPLLSHAHTNCTPQRSDTES